MNVNREKIQKMFDEHFIDDCDEVFDASEEIIDFAIKVVKNCSIPDVSNCECKNLPEGEIAISSKALTDPNWKS